MDFWDLTKLLFRRWYFALPMLLLTAIVSMWIVSSVRPNYIATAYVQLVPPKTQANQPGTATIDQRNPWIGLGLTALANAAIVTVQDEAVVVALAKGGYSETYTVTLGSSSPLITFEITGSSPEQASATADQLVQRYDQNVKDLQQREFPVAESDLIRTTRLDRGTNLTESDARVKRALIGVAGAGLLMTIAWTVGLDALIRLRARRRAGMAAMPPVVTPADRPPRFDRPPAPANRPPRPDVAPAVRMSPDLAGSVPIGAGNGSGGGAPVTVHTPPPAEVRATAPVEPAAPAESPTAVAVTSSDETVVLPLSASVTRRREQSKSDGSQPR